MFPSVSLWFSYVTISRKFRSSSSSSLPVVEPAGSRFIDSQRFGPGNTILSHRSNELRFGLSSSGDESDEFVGISVSGLLFAFLVTKNITGWWFGTCLKKKTIGNFIIQTAVLIFFRGVGIPPTRSKKHVMHLSHLVTSSCHPIWLHRPALGWSVWHSGPVEPTDVPK